MPITAHKINSFRENLVLLIIIKLNASDNRRILLKINSSINNTLNEIFIFSEGKLNNKE